MTKQQKNIWQIGIAGLITIGVFLLDLITPLGIAEGVLYILGLFFLIKVETNFSKILLCFAFLCSFLNFLTIYLHYPPPDWMAYANRGISLLAIWSVVLLLLYLKKDLEQKNQLLRQSERKSKSIVYFATEAIITADHAGNILTWNQAAENIFGWTAAEAHQQSLTLIMPPAYREGHNKGMERYLQTESPTVIGNTIELEGLHKNGTIFPIEISLGSWKSGRHTFFCAIIRDITSRKRSNRRLHLVTQTLDEVRDFILWTNKDGKLINFNNAVTSLLGYSREEFKALNIGQFIVDYDETNQQKFRKRLARKKNLVGECFLRKKDGTPIPAEINAVAVEYEGKIVNCTIFRDISQRKESEQALQQSRENLEKTHQQLLAINENHSRFVPHDFLKLLGHQNILDLKLGDSTQIKMGILFADIRDYSLLSEQMTPEENFQFINAYLGRVGPIIKEYGGFINQYYGDGIMALFAEGHENALKAALSMQEVIHVYNQERLAKNRQPIKVGIGLHVGDLMLGVIGDALRNEASVISKAVNVASRIEGLSKFFGTPSIIFSEALLTQIPKSAPYNYRKIGKFQLKGSSKSIQLFQTFDGTPDMPLYMPTPIRELFERGIDLYYAQQFTAACRIFQQILEKNEYDKGADYYFKQSKKHLANGYNEEWVGFEVMQQK